jgi:amino acid adenylation domain-containing protein/thioester reductase-like protein
VIPFVRAWARVVRRHPQAIAVEDARGIALTHASLWAAAGAEARNLRHLGVGPEDVVALVLPRSIELVVAMLAAWRAGAAWTYVDPALPTSRREALLAIAGTRAIRSGAAGLRLAGDGVAGGGGPPTAPSALRAAMARERARSAPSTLAYVAFTSGSAGQPKGVRVEHRGILRMLRAQIRAFGLGADTRALWVLSPGFDASVSDVGTVLLAGGALLIDAPDVLADPARLARALRARAVTSIDLPPSILPRLPPDTLPKTLQTLVIGGEVADPGTVRAHAQVRRVVNVYGPTEATVCTSLERCGIDWRGGTLGRPLPQVRYRVVDGELWIGGQCLARDYAGDPERTRERFVSDPGGRWYRTGDRVRKDGQELVFEGRFDRQVKLGGRRAEPEEVEAALRALGIQGAVVPRDVMGRTVFVAFVVGATAGHAERLRAMVPGWMVPSFWVSLERLPRSPNGKVDLEALRCQPVTHGAAGWPADPGARRLAELFAAVLGFEAVGPDDDFFALGGDSLALLALLTRAESKGLALTAAQVHAAPTPRALAAAVDRGTDALDGYRSTAELAAALQGMAGPGLQRGARALHGRAPAAARHTHRQRGPRADSIILTGATGFLGARVRAALAARGHTVLSLVRATDDVTARERVGRGEAWAADIERPDFGLDTERLRLLQRRARLVVHLAARVHLTDPLQALAPANVNGTRAAIALAATAGVPLLHASTLSVFVASDRTDVLFMEDDDATQPCRIAGGYAQSKWLAEQLVRAASVPSCIVRYGLLTPAPVTFQAPPRDWLVRFVREVAAMGRAPPALETDALGFDCTPVDHAADATVRLIEAEARGTVHLCGAVPVTARRLLSAMREEGVLDGAGMERDGTVTTVLGAARSTDAGRFARHRALDIFAASGVCFGDARARSHGIVAPAVDDAYLRGCVRAFLCDA